ncbi:MAG: AMP-binding protein [Janthinobacterium lividum]
MLSSRLANHVTDGAIDRATNRVASPLSADASSADPAHAWPGSHPHSIANPQQFWADQAQRIDWHIPPEQILDASIPESPRWFVGGMTNLCHNAVDRHLLERGTQDALIHHCGESGRETRFTYRELYTEVNAMAQVLRELGVARGERVLLYMPVIPETVFAMLACARLGAIHTVVFGGLPEEALASRIDDAQPRVIITADGGYRNGRLLHYRPIVDAALQSLAASFASSTQAAPQLLVVERGLGPRPGDGDDDDNRDGDGNCNDDGKRDDRGALAYAPLRAAVLGQRVPCEWLESNEPSYILYTSGTSGRAKGIVRDTGGHAVALVTTLTQLFHAQPGETMFSTSDLGWVVGHSYGVYAPLLGGMTSLLFEGSPIRPDADVLWRLVARHRVSTFISSPTVMRLVQHGRQSLANGLDLSTLRAVFLAGEPLDSASASALEAALGKPVVDQYWQTETGSPVLSGDLTETFAKAPTGHNEPGLHDGYPRRALHAVCGFRLAVVDEDSGVPVTAHRKGILTAAAPLPPGCLHGLWRRHDEHRAVYWQAFEGQRIYSTYDWAVADFAGSIRLLGRADDAIKVASERIGTAEIEAVLRTEPALADVAVVGINDPLRGQIPVAFAVLSASTTRTSENLDSLAARLGQRVAAALGKMARPRRVFFVTALPRTRSGKVMRRAMQAVFEGRACPDLQTIDDRATLDEIAAFSSA